MADYRSILDRTINGLSENTEETRRTVYDKARSALMRQLSSIEPALSPAEISKQRLQLEEAVRDTESQYNGVAELESAVEEAIAEPDVSAQAPVVDQTPAAQAIEAPVEPVPEPTPAEVEAAPAVEPAPEPIPAPAEPVPPAVEIPTPASEPAPEPEPEPVIEPIKSLSNPEPTPSIETKSAEAVAPAFAPEPNAENLIEEAEATHAKDYGAHNEPINPLDELKKTIEADSPPVPAAPSVAIDTPSPELISDEVETFEQAPPQPELLDPAELTVGEPTGTGDAALAAAVSKKSGGKGIIWLVILLILAGIGTLGWTQRETLGPTITPLFATLQKTTSSFLTSLTQPQEPTDESKAAAENDEDALEKAEDRLLDTPLESAADESEEESTPEIIPGKRIKLPTNENGNQPLVAKPVTPAGDADGANSTAAQLFTSSAILYEERKDSDNPDVSTGNISWEFVENGSESIGSTGLPSVRGNSRIQNRDLAVRFEIMRNLDEELPASHLIEIEFETGELFADDNIKNVAGVLMKEIEDENGSPLVGAVVKVSDTVFWIAMSARAADLASNVDALKKKKWFDIPVLFESGKRAILTLEKGDAGAKAIDQAFEIWEK